MNYLRGKSCVERSKTSEVVTLNSARAARALWHFAVEKVRGCWAAPLHVLPWGKRVWSVHFSLLQERDNMRGRGGGEAEGGP